ncbi:Cytochrome b561 and DOMON domain-containing protein [Rhynchospora pubera]|uniref:Cytochrome b561 and DOMON domain-containing protein n=1 Tax=Rhynchospora pubera TaxID=906938 RepID=A0AAV8HST1_9POAL|nr:Cytochrome b561 and DOMON domain-containing protein [Rhynchospora pubera]
MGCDSSLLLLFLCVAAAAIVAVNAQTYDGCDNELPSELAGNYSGLDCRTVWNTFVLRYSQSKDHELSIVVSTVYTTGWVGMGFSKDGLMVGSSAMVGWMGKTGLHHIKQFLLKGQTSSQVVANEGNLLMATGSEPKVVVDQAKIYLAFKAKFSEKVTRQQILFAFGSSIPVDNKLTKHTDKMSMAFDFSTGSTEAGAYPHNLKRSHGALAIFGWGVLAPIGAIIARYCKRWDPMWFYLHVGIQFVAFIIGLAAVVAGVALYNKLHANLAAHRGLGIFILVLGILQILSFFLRPDKEAKLRKYWNWFHHWVGRLTLFFAAVNIVYGIHVAEAGTSWKAGYGFVLSVILLTTIVLETLLWTRWSGKTVDPPTY